MNEWKSLKLDNCDEVVETLNCLHLKKEDILFIDKDNKTGKITLIYNY